MCALSRFSPVWLFVTLPTVACQSIGLSQQELEWVAICSSRGSSQPTHGTLCLGHLQEAQSSYRSLKNPVCSPYSSFPSPNLWWPLIFSLLAFGIVNAWILAFLGASQLALVVKNWPANAGDIGSGSIPGLGRSLGESHGNPPQYSCLENPIDRGAWWAIVHRVAKSQTWLKRLSMYAGGM